MKDIHFTWAGKNYVVGMAAYDSGLRIILPDGTALKPSMWLESYPPKPAGLKEEPHVFKHCSAGEVAQHLGGILAREA